MINQSNPKQIWYPTSSHEITETWNNLNGKIRLFTVKIYTQNGNRFGLATLEAVVLPCSIDQSNPKSFYANLQARTISMLKTNFKKLQKKI